MAIVLFILFDFSKHYLWNCGYAMSFPGESSRSPIQGCPEARTLSSTQALVKRNWSRPRIKRKEVNVMNEYRKPEVIVLGEAASLIQGSKPGRGDSVDPHAQIAADECTED
jgi:hypothetical protein